MLALPRASVLSVANSELFEKLHEELSALDPWLVYFSPPSSLSYLFVFIYLFIYGYLSYLPLLLSTALRSLQKKGKERKTRKKERKKASVHDS